MNPPPFILPIFSRTLWVLRVEAWSVSLTLRSWYQVKCLVHDMNDDYFVEWRILLASQKWGLIRRLGRLRKARRTGSLWCASFKWYGVEMTAGFMKVRRKCLIFLSFSVFQYGGAQPGLDWSRCKRTGPALVLCWGAVRAGGGTPFLEGTSFTVLVSFALPNSTLR